MSKRTHKKERRELLQMIRMANAELDATKGQKSPAPVGPFVVAYGNGRLMMVGKTGIPVVFDTYSEAFSHAHKIGGNVYGAGDPVVTGREASPSSQDNASEKPDVLDWSYSSGFETNRSKH